VEDRCELVVEARVRRFWLLRLLREVALLRLPRFRYEELRAITVAEKSDVDGDSSRVCWKDK
jgi:hypothetical protein